MQRAFKVILRDITSIFYWNKTYFHITTEVCLGHIEFSCTFPIPKKSGGTRMLGVPTVADPITQMVVKMMLEPVLDLLSRIFWIPSEKTSLDAVERCWEIWLGCWIWHLAYLTISIMRYWWRHCGSTVTVIDTIVHWNVVNNPPTGEWTGNNP